MAEWKTTPMGALCSIKNGKSNTEDAVEDGPYAFFDRSKQVKRSSKYLFDCEALIIPGEGTEFLPKEYRGKFDLHQRAYALYEFKDIDPKYLYYFLIHSKDYWPRVAVGATVKSLRLRHFEDLPVTHPPLPEQQRIVTKLDAAFAALAEAQAHMERNLANARELFESYLNGVFEGKEGWEETTLGELGRVCMCKRILKEQTTATGEIPFYKIGTFGKEPDAFIPKEIYKEFRRKYPFPKKGDVLISASGTIGRGVVYDGEPAYFQDSNIVWIDNNEEQVLNEYLFQFYKVCDWNPTKGATISRLYNDDLRKVRITFPSIPEQRKIVAQMIELDAQTQALESTYQQKLMELEGLKKGLLGAAFRGEL